MPRRHKAAPPESDLYAPIAWTAQGDYEDIRYESADGIAKVTINRPEVLNAFRPQTLIEIGAALEVAREDPEIGPIILTGEGEKSFCSGGDQKVRGSDRISPRRAPPSGASTSPTCRCRCAACRSR